MKLFQNYFSDIVTLNMLENICELQYASGKIISVGTSTKAEIILK